MAESDDPTRRLAIDVVSDASGGPGSASRAADPAQSDQTPVRIRRRGRRASKAPIRIGTTDVPAGERRFVDLPLSPLYTHSAITMPVHVVNGRQPGPVLFVTAAIHGDEINGIEIIRRLLRTKALGRLSGALIAVPVVNVYGFLARSRYLPDRRDLNRAFPGSERGSMTARLAGTLFKEIIGQCTHGIDLHTGAAGRDNLPQIRVDLERHPDLLALAEAFAPPIVLDSPSRSGTLRDATDGMPLLLYEAGEALRFDELAIRAGLQGVLRVMRHLGMLPASRTRERRFKPYVANDSTWLRAPQSGMLRTRLPLGGVIESGETIGIVSDPFGEHEEPIVSPLAGVLIGLTRVPLVHEGEALFHVASTTSTRRAERAAEAVDRFHQAYDDIDGAR